MNEKNNKYGKWIMSEGCWFLIEPSDLWLEENGPQDSEIIDEPIDDEKVAMAEAIIDLNMRIMELEQKLQGGI